MDGEIIAEQAYDVDHFKVQPIDEQHASECFYSDYVIELVAKVFKHDNTSFVNDSRFEHILRQDLTFDLDHLDALLDGLLSVKDVCYDVEFIVEMNQYLDQLVPVFDSQQKPGSQDWDRSPSRHSRRK